MYNLPILPLWEWREVQSLQDWSTILIGNGFSQNIWTSFHSKSLLDTAIKHPEAELAPDDKSIIGMLNDTDFESVLSRLTTTQDIMGVLDPIFDTPELDGTIGRIRRALWQAIALAHPRRSNISDTCLQNINGELHRYKRIFTTNYDLLLYWSVMQDPTQFTDYFGYDLLFDSRNAIVWDSRIPVHYLHGALHLRTVANNRTEKLRGTPLRSILDSTLDPSTRGARLFVAGGNQSAKLQQIRQSDYLTAVNDYFRRDQFPIVVLGLSLADSDSHIVNSLNGRAVAISVYPDDEAQCYMSRVRKAVSGNPVYFFASNTHPLTSFNLSSMR